MRNVFAGLLIIGSFASPRTASAIQQFVDVREVATDTLSDVAVTVITAARPTIYYSPVRMQQIGPKLAAFAMEHEYGHVRYRHGGALLSSDGVRGTRRQQQELEADCYAARVLVVTDPEAIKAALQFFTSMGPFRFDALHPSGAQRAETIRTCLSD